MTQLQTENDVEEPLVPGVDDFLELVPFHDHRRERRSRRGHVALGCALTAVLVAGVVAVVVRNEPRSAAADLQRMQNFVASAGTARFEGTARSEYGEGVDEPGSTSVDVTRIHGSFVLPDRMRFVEDAGDWLDETVRVGPALYFRSGDTRADLTNEAWVYEKVPDAEEARSPGALEAGLDEAGLDAVSAAAGLSGAFGFTDLADMLGRLKGVRRVSPGVLEATMTMREVLPPETVRLFEEQMAELEDGAAEEDAAAEEGGALEFELETEELFGDLLDEPFTIRLTHADDGRLDEMSFSMESGSGEDRSVDDSTIRFSGWGEPVEIVAPDAAEVDPTPGIDEDDLAAFEDFALLAPKTPPAGMVLRSASVSEEEPEYESCASVDLNYGLVPADGEGSSTGAFELAGFLDVSLLDATCPWIDDTVGFFGDEGEPQPVRVGPYRGELRRSTLPSAGDREEVLTISFTTGGVAVRVASSLPQDQLVATLATLGPLDLATQPVDRSEPPPGG